MARIKWTNVASDVCRMARALVEDPEYLAALERRLADGKAPQMMRFLLQWPDQKARDPQELRRGKPPLTVVMKYLPGDPRMGEATAREEEARAQQAARDKPAAPADSSDPDELELVDPADYDLPSYRDP